MNSVQIWHQHTAISYKKGEISWELVQHETKGRPFVLGYTTFLDTPFGIFCCFYVKNNNTRPGKHTKNDGKTPFLMGKSTISMATFNSYFDITRGYWIWILLKLGYTKTS